MKMRKVYLLKDNAFTAARTKTEGIKVVDPISSIDIIVEMTNGATMTEASVVKPHDEFTVIDIADGSDHLVSASMEELQALNVAEMGKIPFMELTLDSAAVQREMCRIHFGLGNGDPNHYLRPGDFINPQISIVNTLTTPAATAWAATGHTLSVIANVIEEGVGAYEGFLTSKSMYAYDAVDAAIETIDMQRDFPYRLIQLQALKTGNSPILTLEKIKLSVDADKYIPIEIDADHLAMANAQLFGKLHQDLAKRLTGGGVIYTDLYHLANAYVTQDTTLSMVGLVTIAGEAVTTEVLVGAAGVNELSAAEGLVKAGVDGYGLHSCLYIPFGRLDHPEDWFKAQEYGDIKLKLTGESAEGAVKVLTQQLRS